jgi:transcriptional regulator with PAS, ATPase and Fis domain
MTDAELIRLLKSEIQDLQDLVGKRNWRTIRELRGRLEERRMPSVEHMGELNLESVKAAAIREALVRAKTATAAAALLGIDRVTLQRCMKRYGIRVAGYQRRAS